MTVSRNAKDIQSQRYLFKLSGRVIGCRSTVTLAHEEHGNRTKQQTGSANREIPHRGGTLQPWPDRDRVHRQFTRQQETGGATALCQFL